MTTTPSAPTAPSTPHHDVVLWTASRSTLMHPVGHAWLESTAREALSAPGVTLVTGDASSDDVAWQVAVSMPVPRVRFHLDGLVHKRDGTVGRWTAEPPPARDAGRAAAWGARLEVLTPPVSPSQWIADAAARGEVRTFDDIRSRRAGLSKACFYGLMEENDRGRTLTMLGLRREESNDRNRVAMHACMAARDRRQSGEAGPRSGLTYWHKGVGAWRCLPVAEFKALEV